MPSVSWVAAFTHLTLTLNDTERAKEAHLMTTASLALMAALLLPVQAGWHVIDPDPPEKWVSLDGIAYLLGGLEATLMTGSARVVSRVQEEDGTYTTVARGEANNRGGWVGLYGGPIATGWKLAPTAGLMNQSIGIQDFNQDVPTPEPPDNGYDIAGQCGDPMTGEETPCDAPNSYDLNLRSVSGGVMAGYDLVVGGPNLHIMGGIRADMNILEYRFIDVELADETRKHQQLSPFRSFGAQTTFGFILPKWHLAFRGTFSFRRHGQFSFGDPIRVNGPTTYDDERNVYYRPLIEVGHAGHTALTAQMSAGLLFR